jgi:DNA-binding CsgD family transcriptional regulator
VDGADRQPQLTSDSRRQYVADYLKTVGARVNPAKHAEPGESQGGRTGTGTGTGTGVAPTTELQPHLSPRQRQTLARLLLGDSEKQVARHLSLSKNTVHVYVKALYRHYNVNSRGELLAKFVAGSGGVGVNVPC